VPAHPVTRHQSCRFDLVGYMLAGRRQAASFARSGGYLVEGLPQTGRSAGRELDPAVITLYRLRWYLDDLASAVRLFRNVHRDTPDTRRWWDGLAPRLEQLPTWLDLLG
jgi:hypothetical protein